MKSVTKFLAFAFVLFSVPAIAGPQAESIRRCESNGGANGCIYRILEALDSRSTGGQGGTPSLAMGTYSTTTGNTVQMHGAFRGDDGSFRFYSSWWQAPYTCDEFGSCSANGYTPISIISRTSFSTADSVFTLVQ